MNDIEFGWGIWKDCYYIGNNANSFTPSSRARHELTKEIERIKSQCGHKTVSVTDK